MKTPLLVFTSDAVFGELIRQSLEETERFSVTIVGQQAGAEELLRASFCPLAFLDATQADVDINGVARSLQQVNPRISFIIITDNIWVPSSGDIQPIGYLSKPFYLPDLLEMIEKAALPVYEISQQADPAIEHTYSSPVPLSVPAPGSEELPWLANVNRAAQHLTRLTLESSAQAALITRQNTLWAYAGQLPQTAARELSDTVMRYWDHEEQSDLVRFIRLDSTKAEYMLYATRLTAGMVLALIFEAETPFTTIRTQASQLVRSLSVSPAESELGDDDDGPGPDLTPLSEILADVPPPNPPREIEYVLPKPMSIPDGIGSEVDPFTQYTPSHSRENSPSLPSQIPALAEDSEPLIDAELEETVKSRTQRRVQREREEAEELAETRPHPASEVTRQIVLEPVSASAYNLTYACLLIPRFISHHLTGDLTDCLSEWVPKTCIAFAWRLEYISVRPDYLQWIVNVPPSTSPGYLMRVMRKEISEKIFEEFPRFKKDNPSGDFWAPGYLIMGGSQPHPAQLIKDFIAQTRQRQGIYKPLRPR